MILNRFIWPIDGALTNATTPGQSESGSNGNEEVLYTPQNWSLTIRYSLVSYSDYPFW